MNLFFSVWFVLVDVEVILCLLFMVFLVFVIIIFYCKFNKKKIKFFIFNIKYVVFFGNFILKCYMFIF